MPRKSLSAGSAEQAARGGSGRKARYDIADFLGQAEWQYKKLSFEKWNKAFDILKEKFRRKRLHDPFETYLHDTYFPLREIASKRAS